MEGHTEVDYGSYGDCLVSMPATGKCLLSFQWKAWGSFLADSGFRMSCKGGQGRLRLKSKVIKWFLFQKTQPQTTILHMEEAVLPSPLAALSWSS